MPRWPEHGLTKQDLLTALHKRRAADLRWREGRVFAGAYDVGDEVGPLPRHVYASYLAEQAASPLQPGAVPIENDLIVLMKELLRAPATACGTFTSGGTEGIVLACLAAREHARLTRGVTAPEVLMSRTAHPAFLKACRLLGMKPVQVGFDPISYRADIDAMRVAITPSTVLLAASAPGYSHGVLDDVQGIAALAMRHGVLCHVDAGVGGLYLSFMRLDRRHVRPFDLSVDGVTSVSVDLHKYGYAPRGAGIVLYRDRELRAHALFASADTTGYALADTGALGTRAIAPLAGAWAAIHTLGDSSYRSIVRETLSAAKRLIDGIGAIPGLRVLGAPAMCVFAVASSKASVFEIEDELRARGWYLQTQYAAPGTPASLHISVNRGNAAQVDALLEALEAATAAASRPAPDLQPLRIDLQHRLDTGTLDVADLLVRLGALPGRLPERWAPFHQLLDALPDADANALLVAYLNTLYE